MTISPPFDHDDARSAAQSVLDLPGADAVEVVMTGSATGVTRYARSGIIQNTARTEIQVYVRVSVGDRAATAATNQLDPEHLTRTGQRALEAARASLPDPLFPGLPSADDVGVAIPILRWDESTAAADPASRAGAAGRMIAASGAENAAGIFETSGHAYAVVSSRGVDCFDAHTRCVATCLVDLGDATGWGEQSSHEVAGVDPEKVATTARAKADRGRDPTTAEPGVYEVVLEPAAVSVLLEYLAYTGFGAKHVIEGESFLTEKAGQQVCAPSITIADDVWHEGSVGIAFDLEGVPKTRKAVIDAGVAAGPVSDLRTSAQLGIENTGHFSGSSQYGPYAANVVLEAGAEPLEALIGAVDDGFLVTRFHYVNVLDRPATLLTGMTRDGIFRIRGGEVTGAVRDLRFAQSVLESLATTLGVGRDALAFAPEYGSFGSTVAPALRLGEFRFSSGPGT